MKALYILFLLFNMPVYCFSQSTGCKDPQIIDVDYPPKVCEGELAEFRVFADNVVSYKWQAKAPNTSGWFNLSSESSNTNTLSFIANIAGNHYAYRCKLIGECSEIYTSETYIFIYQPDPSLTPTITSHPQSVTVSENLPVKFKVEATENWGYQWQHKTSGTWDNLYGEDESILYVNAAFAEMNGYSYRCLVKGCSSTPSNEAALTVVSSGTPNDFNYIKETTLLKEADENTDIAHLPVEEKSVSTAYYDGLGREMQIVSWQASSAKKDVIQPLAYDKYGRETRKYLPFTGGQTNGYYLINRQIIDEVGDYTGPAASFYAAGSDNDVADDSNPWAETIFEPSPMDRVLKQGAPGTAWQPDKNVEVDDNTIRYNYTTNIEEEIFLWEVVDDQCKLSKQHHYDPNELYLTEIRDENWRSSDGDNGVVKEYKDKQGRTVLKRTYQDDVAHDTYYVYDNLNNLRFVIPPEAIRQLGNRLTQISEGEDVIIVTTNLTLSDISNSKKYYYCPGVTVSLSPGFTSANGFEVVAYPLDVEIVDEYLFAYKYDERRRMVEKKVPGADWVYMVYDKRDRLVLTQDGNRREDDEWTFTKYDVLNRPIMTGIYSDNRGRLSVQGDVNGMSNFFETFSTSQTNGYTTQNSFPTNNVIDILTVTYYDNYDYLNLSEFNSNYDFGSSNGIYTETHLTTPTGQVTGIKVKNLGDNSWLRTATYYDNKYRVIRTKSNNHMNGYDKSYNQYDFIGNLTNSRHEHTASGESNLIINTQYTYDHSDRLEDIKYRIGDSGDYTTISRNEYNAIGELIAKKLHSTDGSNFYQTLDYGYNIRGWLKNINDPDNVSLTSGSDYFGMELNYNTANASSALGSVAQYNGNISEIHWKNTQDNTRKTYGFQYDKLNRLTNSTYGEGNSYTTKKNYFNENITLYDYNGNIKNLTRTGNGSNSNSVDNLTYTYRGNRLTGVADAATGTDKPLGFNDGYTGTDYTYDANGNMTKDLNKGISSITYNHLNLPKVVTFNTAGKSVQYVYDANGTKLQKIVTDGTTKTTNYVGGLIYEGTTDKFLNTEEGRIVLKEGGTTKEEYQYHLKDHLGNVRLTFTTGGGTTSSIMATMEAQSAEQEEATFANIENTRQVDELYNITEGGNTSARLNAAEGKVMGPWTSVHVMAGDTVRLKVFAKYDQPTKTREAVTGMGGIIATTITGAKTVDAVREMANTIGETLQGGQASLLAKDNNVPKAYLNYIFFDKEMNSKSTNFKQVTEAAHGSFEALEMEFIAEEEGYVMAYTSNQTNEDLNVFMDQMSLQHTTGPIVRVDDYYPFGLTFKTSELNGKLTNKFLYNGKEREELTDWYDYGWRFYDAALGRWHVIDPLAENTYSLTPYRYAQNNPISVFDIAGLSDYFDANGNYLGTDNTDDDYVRVISQENWDNVQVTDEDGNVSVNVEQGMELSTAFSEATDMSEDATLAVYDHYNPTDLDLAAKQNETGAGGMTFHAERKNGKTSERIDVKIEGNRKTKMADHANEIKNVFAHEEQHYNDYKELGFEGFVKVPRDRREQRAVSTQMKHGSYKGTRPGFQRAVVKYGKKFGMLFPLTPKPAVVVPSSK